MRILGGTRRVSGVETKVTVVDGGDVLENLESRRVPDGMIGRKRIDRVVGGVVAHISDHFVLVAVSEFPAVKTTLVQRRRRGSRFNEDKVATLSHPSHPSVVETVGFAVQAVSHQSFFPRTAFQLLGVRLFMHKRPCPDHPNVSKVRVRAVERLVRRPVVQGCMRSPVAQVDRRVH